MTRLFGRDPEVAEIDGLLHEAANGRAGILVISGDPGIGKSALLAYARDAAKQFCVLKVTGFRSRAEVPYAGLHTILQPLLGGIDRLPSAQAAALRVALGLRDPDDDDPDRRLATFGGAAALIAAAAARQPVLVLVDDAQWLDGDSLAALSFVAQPADAARVAMLIAQRSVAETPFVNAGFSEILLRPLPRQAARDLANASSPRPLSERKLTELLDAAAGNPLVIKVLAERGQSTSRPYTRLVQRLFDAVITELPADERLAVLVAAAGDSDEFAPLLGASRLLGVDFDAWEAAEARGLLVLAGNTVRFAHPIIRAAVIEQASGTELRRVHAAIADALLARGEPARAAWHQAAMTVGADESIAAALEAAAEEYVRRSGLLAAAEALALAAERSMSTADRARRLAAAAKLARRAQHDDWAVELAAAAIALTDEPQTLHVAKLVLAGVEAWHGNLEIARKGYVEVAESAAEHFPGTASDALTDAAAVAIVQVDTTAAKDFAKRALASAIAAAAPEAELAAHETLASVLILRGELDEAQTSLETAAASYERPGAGIGGEYVALSLAWVEQFDRAAKLLAPAIEAAERAHAIRHLAEALEIRADLRFRMGLWKEAAADAEESLRHAQRAREPVLMAYSRAMLAVLAATRGDPAEAREHVRAASELAHRHALRVLDEYTGFALGLLELRLGNPRAALDALRLVSERIAKSGRGTAGILYWPADLIEAAIRCREFDLAKDALWRLEEQARQTGLTWAQAVAARCRGMLAAPKDFTRHFKDAITLHQETDTPFELARTRLAYGERLRRAGRRVEACLQLAGARVAFLELGAADWAQRADDEHRRARCPGRTDSDREELTPTELLAARRAADGESNQQIADGLGTTLHAAEAHMSRIYRKTGLGRAQLASYLDGLAASDDDPVVGEDSSDGPDEPPEDDEEPDARDDE